MSEKDELLARTYRSAFELAVQHNVTSLAIPAISTGAYRFPLERATHIAVTALIAFLGGSFTKKTCERLDDVRATIDPRQVVMSMAPTTDAP